MMHDAMHSAERFIVGIRETLKFHYCKCFTLVVLIKTDG